MVYDAIINGARGLIFFGGALEGGLSPQDKKLGWNWTFWNNVQRRVVEEIGTKSPLHAALMEPNSNLLISVNNSEIEFCVREVGKEIFLIAARKPKTARFKLTSAACRSLRENMNSSLNRRAASKSKTASSPIGSRLAKSTFTASNAEGKYSVISFQYSKTSGSRFTEYGKLNTDYLCLNSCSSKTTTCWSSTNQPA